MFQSHDTKLLLDIQDKNIEIEKDAVELKAYKGKTKKFISAKLTYRLTYCECCGFKNALSFIPIVIGACES